MSTPTDAAAILAAAQARANARAARHTPPDYQAANKAFRQQKAALTRAVNSKDRDKVVMACKKAVEEWSRPPFNGAWPDAWSNWERALNDVLPWNQAMDLRDL